MNELLSADCYPITVAPGLHRLFLDYCSGAAAARQFYTSLPPDESWRRRPPVPAHWPELIDLVAAQNPAPAATHAIEALRGGAGTVLTGQQVGLFGGPLFTPYKAASVLAHARVATSVGQPHVGIFWMASEDHDFAEINHVVFPARRAMSKLVYRNAPQEPVPVGGIVLDDSITGLVDQARELVGDSDATDALAAAYQPGRTFAEAFAAFYSQVFAAQGLLVLDAGSRAFHRLGAPVLSAAIERADELHQALLVRNQELQAAGYHTQVAVGPQSSLLFLLDRSTGARIALKRQPASAQEPDGIWNCGRERYSTDDLVGVLASEPERISPAALLRPVFQDYLLSTSATVGGPAEVAYFAQSAVLYERILGQNVSGLNKPGRPTPVLSRFSATLVEPEIGDLLRRHDLTPERVIQEFGIETGRGSGADAAAGLAHFLAARALPAEAKRALAAAGSALEAELTELVGWMQSTDDGLGRSAQISASKMRYQMSRLRRLAANFQLQREARLTRHVEAISQALYPDGMLQERLHGAACYFARYGLGLAEELTVQAAKSCPGHTVLWL